MEIIIDFYLIFGGFFEGVETLESPQKTNGINQTEYNSMEIVIDFYLIFGVLLKVANP